MSLQNSYRTWRAYRNTVASLRRLDERQLADLGMTRGDITEIARRSTL